MNDTIDQVRNRQVLLVEKPSGKLGPEHFKMAEGHAPEPKDGEALVRVRYISLDAANRAWMHGATYRAAVEANTVMAGGGIAEVVASKDPSLKRGDIVFGDTGWQDYAAVPAKHLSKMPALEPMTHLLSVYGIAGLTAYFGLLHVGLPKQGETVVVSAAAGSVGSIVGQIAKIKGCRVVGIAGGKDKCRIGGSDASRCPMIACARKHSPGDTSPAVARPQAPRFAAKRIATPHNTPRLSARRHPSWFEGNLTAHLGRIAPRDHGRMRDARAGCLTFESKRLFPVTP